METSMLTNRGMVASIVFEVQELATFEEAERIADMVCSAFGVNPKLTWKRVDENSG